MMTNEPIDRIRLEKSYSNVKNVYKEPIKIKEKKYIHLEHLKLVLPKHT